MCFHKLTTYGLADFLVMMNTAVVRLYIEGKKMFLGVSTLSMINKKKFLIIEKYQYINTILRYQYVMKYK